MGSWKTTVFGIMAGAGAAIALIEGVPQWLKITAQVCACIGTAGIGLSARDNDKSSEDVGAHDKGAGRAGTGMAGLILAFFGVALLATTLLFTGCASARLEPGGAYAPVDTNGVATVEPDMAFYSIDCAYDLAYTTGLAVFTFERDNRPALWQLSPNIKHTLDAIRPQFVAANQQYLAARAVYLAHPVPANLTAVENILAHMRQIVETAKAAIPPPAPK